MAASMWGGNAGPALSRGLGPVDGDLNCSSVGEGPPLKTIELRLEWEGSTGEGSKEEVSVPGVSAPLSVTVLLMDSVGDA